MAPWDGLEPTTWRSTAADTVIYGTNKIKKFNYFSAGPSGCLPRLNQRQRQRLSFPDHTTSGLAQLYLCS